MDCDYDKNLPSTSKDKKKRNRYDKKGNKIDKSKFDENDEEFEKYADELYELDYEDMIGDIPCRFKYREVIPNSFGLSIEEILIAKDRELNRWCSLKKATQHRPEHVENYEVMAYQKKAQNEALKKKILSSLYDELEELTEDNDIKLNKEILRKDSDDKKHLQEDNIIQIENNNDDIPTTEKDNMDSKSVTKKEKKRSKKNKLPIKEAASNTRNDINSFVEEPTKEITEIETKKDKKKKRKKNNSTSIEEAVTETVKNSNLKQSKENQVIISRDKNSANHNSFSLMCEETKNSEINSLRENDNSVIIDKKVEQKNLEETNNQLPEIKITKKLTRRQRRNKNKLQQKASSDSKTINDSSKETVKKQKRKRKNSEQTNDNSPTKKMKLNKNKEQKSKKGMKEEMQLSNSRLQAYGFNPKKFKNKLKYKK